MHTVPLPGIQFFDAWRIRPSLTPDPKMGEKLPLLGTEELIPEEPPNVDYAPSGHPTSPRARKRCPRSCQDHCSTCLGDVTCPSTGDTHHRESGPAQGPRYAKEVLSGRSQGKLQGEVSCRIHCSQEAENHRCSRPHCYSTAHSYARTSQPSGAPFPYPFTRTPSVSGTLSAPSQSAPPSVPTPPARPADQQEDQSTEPTQRGIQAGAPPIPRSFCDDILTVLANLPDEWPLVKIDLILSKAETYYVSWRRFLYLNERLRTLDADPAARAINRNKDRILEHLVQVLSEWIVASIEPAKELTRTKEPEFMFLHTKDFWFRSIWIDLHQALTIDRESSRDRAPIGLVRCICKDDHVKGKHAHVKFKLSNIHAFVPIWMAPMMLRNFRLIVAQSSPLSPLGQLDYREGWFAIVPKEGEPGETLCGIQAHLTDKSLAEFPNVIGRQSSTGLKKDF